MLKLTSDSKQISNSTTLVSTPVFSQISEISTEKTFWNTKCKVIRLWHVSDFNRNIVPFSIEMVLIDEAGGRIHATVKKTLLYKFKNVLFEGKSYNFENLGVANNGGSYRTTRHSFKLNFQYSTKVQCLPSFNITRSPYHFVPISDIVGGGFDTDFLPDVIGVLFGVGSEREIEKNGNTTKLNIVELENDGYKLQCTLFGSYVDDLNNFIASGDIQNAVVIIQLGKAKVFQDKIYVHNCLYCTRVIFNPTCADGMTFRKRLYETVDTPSPLALTQLQTESRVDPKDDFLVNTPRSTMQGLKDASINSVYVVLGTVKRIVNPDSFWYTACICSKAVIPDSQMFFCEKCDKHVKKVFPRYCLRIRAIDHTDCATLVIFDRDAIAMFNKSCADMLAEHAAAISEGQLPLEISKLIGQTFLFKVETRSDFSPRFEQSFRVRKVCFDPVIIKTFMTKWEKEDAVLSKHNNESTSLSVLMDKGNQHLICSSSNTMSQETISLSDPVEKIKQKVVDLSGGVKQDLMPKFSGVISQHDEESVTFTEGCPSNKRESPTNDDQDMDVPLKLLKRSVKIEKL